MTTLATWRPFSELRTCRRDVDDIFDHFFGKTDGGISTSASAFVPAAEWFTRDDEIVVRLDLPGIDAKEVELTVEGQRLTVSGERKSVTEEESHSEVRYGSFSRAVRLPRNVDAESVNATYKDGVLEITMKAPAGTVARKVPITVH
jgi:HSP20 family protein